MLLAQLAGNQSLQFLSQILCPERVLFSLLGVTACQGPLLQSRVYVQLPFPRSDELRLFANDIGSSVFLLVTLSLG